MLITRSVKNVVMLLSLMLYTDSPVPLNHACTREDVCADVNAECRRGVCLCTPLYYENNTRCGTIYCLKITLSYLGSSKKEEHNAID